MARQECSTVIVILVVLVSYSKARFENLYSTCESNSECGDKHEQVPEMVCKDGWCLCNEPHYTLYVKAEEFSLYEEKQATFSCRGLKNVHFYIKKEEEKLVCNNYTDGERCLCQNGTFYVDRLLFNGCKDFPSSDLSAQCNHYDNFCDFRRSLECHAGSCRCKKDMMYDFDNKTCIPKTIYLKENNLTRYRVTHGVYCSSDSDCLEGLSCESDFTCHCPSYCKYDKKKFACDCGEVTVESAPVIVGVFGGFIITVFWCMMIRKSLINHKKKNLWISRVPLDPVNDSSPSSVPAQPSEDCTAEASASFPPPAYSELPGVENITGPLPYPVTAGPNLTRPTPSAPADLLSDSPSAGTNSTGTDVPNPLPNATAPIGFSDPHIANNTADRIQAAVQTLQQENRALKEELDAVKNFTGYREEPPSYDEAMKGTKE